MDTNTEPGEHPLKGNVAVQPIVKLAVVQFVLYSASLSAAAIGWFLVISDNQALLATLFGEYLADHLNRWTSQVPLWGLFAGVAGLLGLASASELNGTRILGVALGVASYVIAFAIDLAVARALFSHVAAGMLVGWTLLSPLVFGRKYLLASVLRSSA